MPKCRLTYCQDAEFTKGMWFFSPIDLRKKYYFCHHCQKKHLTKAGINENNRTNVGTDHTGSLPT